MSFSSQGRIEGRGEPVFVGANAIGVVEKLFVRQGDSVKKGMLLARVDCKDLRSEIAALEADGSALVQSRVRLVTGARAEERGTATAKAASAAAASEQARSHYDRMLKLDAEQVISRSELDTALRDRDVAEADFMAAQELEHLANARPLPEDLARVDAQIEGAGARVTNARDRLSRCEVVSPIDGTVLRTNINAGELLTTFNPQPILTLVDTSVLRVRAEVDEKDIAEVRKGGRVAVTIESYPGKRLLGHVSVITAAMGRKKVRTPDPAERADRDVLEVIADLDRTDVSLPVGLRVAVQFLR